MPCGSRWTVHRSEHVIRDRWISVRADECSTPAGVRVAPYYVLECPDFVHVFATDEADRVILVRQYRHGMQADSLELPGGMMDAEDNSTMAVAARELREETGFHGGTLTHVTTLSIDPARYTNRVHLIRATGVTAGISSLEPTEDVEVVLVSREEAKRLALSSGIANAVHVGLILIAVAEA